MLWMIRDRMRPALSVIDLIPNIHRTPALAALRKAALDGRTHTLRLSAEDRELAFYDAPVALVSPIGGRLLLTLYREGRLKLKKPPTPRLPALEAYVATEPAFRAEVAALLEVEEARNRRMADIIADPACARPEELTPKLIDRVLGAHLGHGVTGSLEIAGLVCHRTRVAPPEEDVARQRAEDRVLCWWVDGEGRRQGDAL